VRRRLRRFAAVGLLLTTVDVGILLALRMGVGLPVIVADAIAIAIASALSFGLNRLVTFADDPRIRWVHQPGAFVLITVMAGILDVAVLRTVVAVSNQSRDLEGLLVAKAIALACAGLVRVVGYRMVLFEAVREAQAHRADRGPAPGRVRLSVVVPAFREERRIGATLAELRTDLAEVGAEDLEVIVVDDGSPDATARAARTGGADVVIELTPNQGKGAAVRAGVLAATGRTIAFIDADLSYAPAQLFGLLAEVEAGWDMVVGSRRHVETTTLVRAGRLREAGGRAINALTMAVLLGQYRDTQCGIKAFRSDAARLMFGRARIDRFAFDVELFHLAERYRLSLTEVPVSLANSSSSTVRVGLDALRVLRDIFRIRRWASRGVYDLTEAEQDQMAAG
jgi:dolichyl-phosphate beta-glucosyltransferase